MTQDWLKDFGKTAFNEEPLIAFVFCECGDTLCIPRDSRLTEVEGWRDCGLRGTRTRMVHKAKLFTHELENELNEQRND
jgi:hypothetical protein